MLGLLLIACGPGHLEAWGEKEALRSAWVFQEDAKAKGLLLSTSHLPCSLDHETDPTTALLETQALSHVLTREGSRLLWLPLGEAEIEAGVKHPVEALYFEVIESELLWTDRLTSAYRATETREEMLQGEFLLEGRTESAWSGSISLDDGALSAIFRAESCSFEDVFLILGLDGVG